jgi:uncharacterized membrane-anchored protein YhcB (DUF1043 family)
VFTPFNHFFMSPVLAQQPAPPAPAPQPAPPADLADIAGPVPIELAPAFPWTWVIISAVGVLVLAMIFILMRERTRKSRRLQNPTEKARYRLNQAEQEHLETEDCYQFSIRLADILRDYVTATTGLAMGRQTSPEFLQNLQGTDQIPQDARETIHQFLERSDAFKFAKIHGTREDNVQLLEQARLFVKQSSAVGSPEEPSDPQDPQSSQKSNTPNPPQPVHA